MKIKDLRIKTRLVIIGVIVTFIPLSIIMATVLSQNQTVVSMGETESLNLAYADLDHIVDNLYTLAKSHQEVTQKNINAALNVARDLSRGYGEVNFSEDTVAWNAVNQYTKASNAIELPKMMFGNRWLGKIAAPDQQAPLVDRVQELIDVTCTVFQRMNAAGDMLRVATNVIKTNGQRAIGTYIPAINPNGAKNPVISTVLDGQTYRGRAFVVNAWYITAYEPIFNSQKNVVGVLYVGIPQENVKSLRQAILKMTVGKTGFVTVLDSSGKYVISKGGQQDEKDVSGEKDASGKAYIDDRIQAASAFGQ